MKEIFYAAFIEKYGYLAHRVYPLYYPKNYREWFVLPESYKLKSAYLLRSDKSMMISNIISELQDYSLQKSDIQIHRIILTDEVEPNEDNYIYVFKNENKYVYYRGDADTQQVDYLLSESLDNLIQPKNGIISVCDMSDFDFKKYYLNPKRHKLEWESDISALPVKVALIFDGVVDK